MSHIKKYTNRIYGFICSKKLHKYTAMIVVMCFALIFLTSFSMNIYTPATASPVAATFTPPFSVLRIGLNFGNTALPSANLQNVSGYGEGFEFGFFDASRNFIPVGVSTSEIRISMLQSRNMVWHPFEGVGAGQYREGSSGDVVVGGFHIILSGAHISAQDALNAASAHSGAFQSFSIFRNGQFFGGIGQFTSNQAAADAIYVLGLSGSASVFSGSDRAITVTVTGTNSIIFLFDYGTTRSLSVRPLAPPGVVAETWFAGFRYNGAFQYERRTGGLITVVNFVDVEPYVKGVVPYEMSPSWHIEALKAQAVAARTYGLLYINRHGSLGFDLCNNEHCQVYRGRNNATAHTDRSVIETAGLVMTHNGRLAAPYYASSHGGASEDVENVWITALPHLRGVFDPFEASVAHRIHNYHWTHTLTAAEVTERLRSRGNFNNASIVSVELEFTSMGNVLAAVFRDVNGASFRIRGRDSLTRILGVRSIRFNIDGQPVGAGAGPGGQLHVNDPAQAVTGAQFFAITGSGDVAPVSAGAFRAIDGQGNIVPVDGGRAGGAATSGIVDIRNGVTFRGAGWGHNVGMSQWGALAQAEIYGRNFREILQFYFTGVEIS